MTIARIAALAAAIPKEQTDILQMGFDEVLMRRTMKLTGVHSVRCAPDQMTSLDYCLRAAKAIFDTTEHRREEVDGIVFATPHPDHIYPGNSNLLQSKLGLRKKCIGWDINHLCTGMIDGFYLADRMIAAGDCKKVLVCCGDTSARHVHPKDRALRVLLGDGGAAALLTADGKDAMKYAFCRDGEGFSCLYTPAGGERMPRVSGITDVEEVDSVENVRTLEHEHMDGMEVMRFVMREVPLLIDEVLEKSAWKMEDISVCALHQANVMILKNLRKIMEMPKEKVLVDIDGVGNIGGASLVLALCHANEHAHAPWGRALFAAFGAGLAAVAMTADLSETEILPAVEL